MTTLTELVNDFALARKQFQASASAALKGAFKEFFEKYPEVESLAWPQYAPYFNDGEPCEFSVYEIREIVVNGEEFDIDYGDREVSEVLSRECLDAIDELSALITHSELEDTMRVAFTSDGKVIATAKGFTTDEYSHD